MIGALLQIAVVSRIVPVVSRIGLMPLASWMIVSVPLIFLPIILGGLLILRFEKCRQKPAIRLRFHKINKQDWFWMLARFAGMAVGSAAAFQICVVLGLNTLPPFAHNVTSWAEGNLWMFILWAVYWPVNILGENLVWRGIILPRMEIKYGKRAWLVNAFLWGIFHLAFGWGNLIVLLPTLLIVPFITQKTKNTWTAVILHACLSGPGFMALAFGLT